MIRSYKFVSLTNVVFVQLQEPRKWQISRAGGIEAVVRSMMANPGSEVVQHRGTQVLRNLHTQLTDWAHKHRREVAEVGVALRLRP